MKRLPSITEDEFMTQVAQLAQLLRWRVAHFRPLRTKDGWRTACQFDAKGFPDAVLVRAPRLVVAELKRSERDKPTPEQEAWLAAWRGVPGAEVFCWRPSDWATIEEVLR